MSRFPFFVGFGSSRISVPFRRVVGLALSGGLLFLVFAFFGSFFFWFSGLGSVRFSFGCC
jgi:hypothetical protein